MIDKTKYKNWIDGDTFAIKIENVNSDYDGQYIILIKNNRVDIKDLDQYCPRTPNRPIFYVKITTNYSIPQTKEEIDSLEFVKISLWTWEERYLPYSGLETYEELKKRKSHIKFYPDEFMFLYGYIVEILIGRKNKEEISKFNYIGNFDISLPNDEFIPGNIYRLSLRNNIATEFIELYEGHNKRKFECFTPEGIKAIKEQEKRTIEFRKYDDQFTQMCREKNNKINKNDVDNFIKEVIEKENI